MFLLLAIFTSIIIGSLKENIISQNDTSRTGTFQLVSFLTFAHPTFALVILQPAQRYLSFAMYFNKAEIIISKGNVNAEPATAVTALFIIGPEFLHN